MRRIILLLIAAALMGGCATYKKIDEWNRAHSFLDDEDRAALKDLRDQGEQRRTKGAVVYGPDGRVWRVIYNK